MSDMPRDVVLPTGIFPALEDLASFAVRAEDLGYSRVSLGEVTGYNAVTVLSVLADRTERIGLLNNVFTAYSRSPALLGQTAVSLDRASEGRYRLGHGVGSPASTSGS